jgi:hypothetical protein
MLHTRPFSRASFWLKALIGALLAGLADALFFNTGGGATVGVFAFAWLAGLIAVRPGLARDPRALTALAAAAGFALVLVDRPGWLAWALFVLMLAIGALSARVKRDEPAWRWTQRLVVAGAVSLAGPTIDLIRLGRLRRRGKGERASPLGLLKLVLLPLVGGAVFLALFASANPLIADGLNRLRLPPLSGETILRAILWTIVLIMVGAVFRPRWRGRLIALPTLRAAGMPGVTGASITLSLIVFNAVFALQNGLDVAFLWSGAPLPGDLTLARYAHRGAYPLIGTALLAGLFVLVALRPGSETARKPLVRGLVVLWVAQNMLLVASSLLRTANYVEAFGLTRFRLVAMIWMVMVGIGLLLICWRMLRDHDGHWLIDANARLALVVLAALSIVDLGAITAAWNVRHAREVDGTGAWLDVGYLRSLDSSAAVSLVELEQATTVASLRDRLAPVRADTVGSMRRRQARWTGWTWRDARRLQKIERLTAARAPATPGDRRDPDGRLPPLPVEPAPPPVVVSTSAPLTSAPGV